MTAGVACAATPPPRLRPLLLLSVPFCWSSRAPAVVTAVQMIIKGHLEDSNRGACSWLCKKRLWFYFISLIFNLLILR